MKKEQDEDEAAWREIRHTVANIIGFHELAEHEGLTLSHVQRLQFEAQVYAGCVHLARQLIALARRRVAQPEKLKCGFVEMWDEREALPMTPHCIP